MRVVVVDCLACKVIEDFGTSHRQGILVKRVIVELLSRSMNITSGTRGPRQENFAPNRHFVKEEYIQGPYIRQNVSYDQRSERFLVKDEGGYRDDYSVNFPRVSREVELRHRHRDGPSSVSRLQPLPSSRSQGPEFRAANVDMRRFSRHPVRHEHVNVDGPFLSYGDGVGMHPERFGEKIRPFRGNDPLRDLKSKLLGVFNDLEAEALVEARRFSELELKMNSNQDFRRHFPFGVFGCHMCRMYQRTMSELLTHLSSSVHLATQERIRIALQNISDGLIKEAQRMNALESRNIPQERMTPCEVCMSSFAGSICKHEESAHHRKILEFNWFDCRSCNVRIMERAQSHRHILTAQHIKNTLERLGFNSGHLDLDKFTPADDLLASLIPSPSLVPDEDSQDSISYAHPARAGDDADDIVGMIKIPDRHNHDVPLGLDMIVDAYECGCCNKVHEKSSGMVREVFLCRVCNKSFSSKDDAHGKHSRSGDHFIHYSNYAQRHNARLREQRLQGKAGDNRKFRIEFDVFECEDAFTPGPALAVPLKEEPVDPDFHPAFLHPHVSDATERPDRSQPTRDVESRERGDSSEPGVGAESVRWTCPVVSPEDQTPRTESNADSNHRPTTVVMDCPSPETIPTGKISVATTSLFAPTSAMTEVVGKRKQTTNFSIRNIISEQSEPSAARTTRLPTASVPVAETVPSCAAVTPLPYLLEDGPTPVTPEEAQQVLESISEEAPGFSQNDSGENWMEYADYLSNLDGNASSQISNQPNGNIEVLDLNFSSDPILGFSSTESPLEAINSQPPTPEVRLKTVSEAQKKPESSPAAPVSNGPQRKPFQPLFMRKALPAPTPPQKKKSINTRFLAGLGFPGLSYTPQDEIMRAKSILDKLSAGKPAGNNEDDRSSDGIPESVVEDEPGKTFDAPSFSDSSSEDEDEEIPGSSNGISTMKKSQVGSESSRSTERNAMKTNASSRSRKVYSPEPVEKSKESSRRKQVPNGSRQNSTRSVASNPPSRKRRATTYEVVDEETVDSVIDVDEEYGRRKVRTRKRNIAGDAIMNIFVKVLNGPECSVALVNSSTVSELKEKVCDKLGVPSALQKIVYKGRTLSNEKTVVEHGVEDGAKVHLLVANVKPQPRAPDAPWETSDTSALWTHLHEFLKPRFPEAQCVKVSVDFFNELRNMLDTLGLDDLERLATCLLQVENNSGEAGGSLVNAGFWYVMAEQQLGGYEDADLNQKTAAEIVFTHLRKVRPEWKFEHFFHHSLKMICFRVTSYKGDFTETVVPVSSSVGGISPLDIGRFCSASNSNKILMAMITDDSDVLYYEIQDGFLPTTPKLAGMKLTQVLFRANYARWKRFQWRAQCKRIVRDDGLKKSLESTGIQVEDALQFVNSRMQGQIIPLLNPKDYPFTEEIPDYGSSALHSSEAFDINNSSVGVPGEGLTQIQRLTRTLVRIGYPIELENQIGSFPKQGYFESELRKYTEHAQFFDPTQTKLPREAESVEDLMGYRKGTTIGIRKRLEYGVPLKQRGEIMVEAMLRMCSIALSRTNPSVKDRITLRNVDINVPVDVEKNAKIVLRLRGDRVVMSKEAISPWANVSDVFETQERALPEIYPLGPLAFFKTTNVYRDSNFFPLAPKTPFSNVHTVFSLYDDPNCEWDVSQKIGRALLHSFGWAVANARHKFGESVKELPHPVAVQVVHTDGREFTFGCFQLNTLDLRDQTSAKNLFWYLPPLNLWTKCGFREAAPFIEGFNPQVMQNFLPLFLSGVRS
ncbi:unnamed protein product [Notodromas monacha]|uniref:Large ribosomal subunit protein mL37 n=1 Tax=Notodromas monacha TaxID=399045 RepID=A0A7R9GBN6_9CRUS|nr:unnamed protein product [Notodromas monacha]CAG0916562.1 unnamed protein product [Notodromas monacha]